MGLLSELRPVRAVLHRQHTLLEGPRIVAGGALLYSDVIRGGVYRHTPDGELRVLVPRRRGVGGLVPHARGGVVVSGRDLLLCEEDGDVALLDGDGVTGYNDLSTTADGELLVGALRFRPFAGEEPAPGLVLRVGARGRASVLSEQVLWPNGIGSSPDGARLYVSDYARGHVRAIAPEGGGEEVFCESPRGSADGLAVDAEGGVWVALGEGGGVARFHADGSLHEVVEVPARFVSSISFGGGDGCDVLISTADNTLMPDTGGTLFTARSEVPGLALEPARV